MNRRIGREVPSQARSRRRGEKKLFFFTGVSAGSWGGPEVSALSHAGPDAFAPRFTLPQQTSPRFGRPPRAPSCAGPAEPRSLHRRPRRGSACLCSLARRPRRHSLRRRVRCPSCARRATLAEAPREGDPLQSSPARARSRAGAATARRAYCPQEGSERARVVAHLHGGRAEVAERHASLGEARAGHGSVLEQNRAPYRARIARAGLRSAPRVAGPWLRPPA